MNSVRSPVDSIRSSMHSVCSPVDSVRSSMHSVCSPVDSVRSPVPASPAELQPGASEPHNDDDDDDDDDAQNDDGLSTVPQVMVGPDGNIIINPGRL